MENNMASNGYTINHNPDEETEGGGTSGQNNDLQTLVIDINHTRMRAVKPILGALLDAAVLQSYHWTFDTSQLTLTATSNDVAEDDIESNVEDHENGSSENNTHTIVVDVNSTSMAAAKPVISALLQDAWIQSYHWSLDTSMLTLTYRIPDNEKVGK